MLRRDNPIAIPSESTTTMTNRRDRMLIFRLTQDEYELLRQACLMRGGRSLSEFIRGELMESIHGARENHELRGRLREFEQQIHRLEAALDILASLIHERSYRGQEPDAT